jgi:outer membrane receptor for ferrienterochelin and colicin
LVFRGGLQQNFNQIPTIYGGGENTTYNPYVQLAFNNQLGKDTAIGFQAIYGSTPSQYFNINQAQQLFLALTLSRNITSRLSANANVGYQNNYYNQAGYSTPGNVKPGSFYSNYYTAGLGLAYRLYRNLSLTAGYQYNGQTSGNSSQVGPYNQNIAYIGVQATFGGRRRE